MMLKQVATRNQRSPRSLKLKQALQIFVLVVIGIWLLYQVKQSYYKKGAMEEKSGVSENGGIMRIGRKDLKPRIDEKHGDEDVELEEEESKSRETEEEEGGEEAEKERSEEAENDNDQFQDFIDEDDKDG